MTDAPNYYDYYGYCPTCFAPGVMRQRRPHGDDRCSNHHIYPSANALTQSEMIALLAERAAKQRIADLEAENERLREALELIAVQDQGCGGTLSPAKIVDNCMRIARAAREDKG